MRFAILGTLSLLYLVPMRHSSAEDLVAIVDLQFLEETDQTAAVMCFGESDTDCDVWATHYLWEARVRKVISGVEPEKRFLVLFGRHALKKQNFRNVLAVMDKLEPGAYANARYQILDWGQERKLVCFDDLAAPNAPITLSNGHDQPKRCFDSSDGNQ